MTILERVDQDFKGAMRAKDDLALSVLRLLRTALKNKQIELMHDLADTEAQAVLKTMVKQYSEALADFRSAGRLDLAERQAREIDLLSKYLPPSMPPEELERLVREALAEQAVTDVGRAMGIAMKAVQGKADGAEVRRVVEKLLGGSGQ